LYTLACYTTETGRPDVYSPSTVILRCFIIR
jgi:hypothetical protein